MSDETCERCGRTLTVRRAVTMEAIGSVVCRCPPTAADLIRSGTVDEIRARASEDIRADWPMPTNVGAAFAIAADRERTIESEADKIAQIVTRWRAIESAARALEAGLDAQDIPAEKREALLRLRVALAGER